MFTDLFKKNGLNWFQMLKATLRFREAVRKADEEHMRTGARYYVMPLSGNDGKLVILDRYDFRKLKHKGYIPSKVFVRDLERECFYFTPARGGNGRLQPGMERWKRGQFYHWYAWCARSRKMKKRHGALREK